MQGARGVCSDGQGSGTGPGRLHWVLLAHPAGDSHSRSFTHPLSPPMNCSWQFYATWCQGCKALFPHMAELAAQRPDIKFLLIEGEENKVGPPPVHTRAPPTPQLCRCVGQCATQSLVWTHLLDPVPNRRR